MPSLPPSLVDRLHLPPENTPAALSQAALAIPPPPAALIPRAPTRRNNMLLLSRWRTDGPTTYTDPAEFYRNTSPRYNRSFVKLDVKYGNTWRGNDERRATGRDPEFTMRCASRSRPPELPVAPDDAHIAIHPHGAARQPESTPTTTSKPCGHLEPCDCASLRARLRIPDVDPPPPVSPLRPATASSPSPSPPTDLPARIQAAKQDVDRSRRALQLARRRSLALSGSVSDHPDGRPMAPEHHGPRPPLAPAVPAAVGLPASPPLAAVADSAGEPVWYDGNSSTYVLKQACADHLRQSAQRVHGSPLDPLAASLRTAECAAARAVLRLLHLKSLASPAAAPRAPVSSAPSSTVPCALATSALSAVDPASPSPSAAAASNSPPLLTSPSPSAAGGASPAVPSGAAGAPPSAPSAGPLAKHVRAERQQLATSALSAVDPASPTPAASASPDSPPLSTSPSPSAAGGASPAVSSDAAGVPPSAPSADLLAKYARAERQQTAPITLSPIAPADADAALARLLGSVIGVPCSHGPRDLAPGPGSLSATYCCLVSSRPPLVTARTSQRNNAARPSSGVASPSSSFKSLFPYRRRRCQRSRLVVYLCNLGGLGA